MIGTIIEFTLKSCEELVDASLLNIVYGLAIRTGRTYLRGGLCHPLLLVQILRKSGPFDLAELCCLRLHRDYEPIRRPRHTS